MVWFNETLLGSNWCVDTVILGIEQWLDGKHFLICKPNEIYRSIIVLLPKLLAAC